jgi:hypothetical protein
VALDASRAIVPAERCRNAVYRAASEQRVLCAAVENNLLQPRQYDGLGPFLAGHVGRQEAEDCIYEPRRVEEDADLVGKVPSKLAGTCGYVIDELVAPVDERHDVLEIPTSEVIAVSAAAEGLELGRDEVRRRDCADDDARWQVDAPRVGQGGGLPPVLESEQPSLSWHRVEDQWLVRRSVDVTPSANDGTVDVLAEAALSQTVFERFEVGARGDLDHDIDIFRGPWHGCAGIRDPQAHACPADECDVSEQRAKGIGGGLQ